MSAAAPHRPPQPRPCRGAPGPASLLRSPSAPSTAAPVTNKYEGLDPCLVFPPGGRMELREARGSQMWKMGLWVVAALSLPWCHRAQRVRCPSAAARGGSQGREPQPRPHGLCPAPRLRPREAGQDPPLPTGCPCLESGAKPWGQLCSSCAPASSRWHRAGWSLQRGQAVSEVSVGAAGCVCMRYLRAGERGCGWPGAELPRVHPAKRPLRTCLALACRCDK